MNKARRIILTILAILGLCLTAELVVIFVKNNFYHNLPPSFCSTSNLIDCDGVSKTTYSLFLGVPLAIWGTLFYILILFLTYVDKLWQKITFFKVFKNPRSYIATLGIIAFLCSITLATISIFEIKKICVLCFVTYFIDLFIAITAISGLKDFKNTVVDFIDGVKKYTLLFVVVLLSAIGLLIYTNESLVFSPRTKEYKEIGMYIEMKTNPYAIYGNTLGNKNSKVKYYVYSDFLCPFCKTMNIMAHKLGKDVKDVEIIHMNYPLDSTCNPYVPRGMHPGACALAQYAIAAKKQDNYWGMVNMIYDNIPKSEEELLNLAADRGFDTEKLKKDAYSKTTKKELKDQIEVAHQNGVQGTPVSIIDGIFYMGGMPYSNMVLKVKQAQKRHQKI